MFRAAVWTLRQKRYATLAVAFFALALVCVAAGTFELHRYLEKHHDNRALRVNASAASVPLTAALVPPTGQRSAPDPLAIRYRTVATSGTYLTGQTRLVDNQSQGGKQGFYVVTPLRTPSADLLVARGFVAQTASGGAPSSVAPPPTGLVRISGRLQTASSQIDPTHAAGRLGRPVFPTWLSLDKGAPGTAGLRSLPKPGLSNPTGGASEWQLLSYVVQWYAFALLALIAPFLFARAEVRETRRRFLGIDEDNVQFDADRADPADPAVAALDSARTGAELELRGEHGLARRDPAAAARLARAQRLADRYGRPLGHDPEHAMTVASSAPVAREQVVRNSSEAAYRASDEYHADYNDYLWQLALADGNIPQVEVPHVEVPRPEPDADSEPAPHPRVIEGGPADGTEPDD